MHHSSIPEMVMATGTIAPVSPFNARQDVTTGHVNYVTRVPVGMQPGSAQYSPPPGTIPGPASMAMMPADSPLQMLGADVEMLGYGFGGFDAAAAKAYALGTLGGLAFGLLASVVFGYPGERLRAAVRYGAAGAGGGMLATAIART